MSKRIAWVDDDIDILSAMMFPLRRKGFIIDEYYDVADVLHNIDNIRSCDLILLDMILPPGNPSGHFITRDSDEKRNHPLEDVESYKEKYGGLSILRSLRTEYSISIPIIVLSTAAGVEHFTQMISGLSVSSVLPKPCHLHELMAAIDAAINSNENNEII